MEDEAPKVELDGDVLTVTMSGMSSGWEQWFLLISDVHWVQVRYKMTVLVDNYMQNVTGVTTNKPTPADGDNYTFDGDNLTYAALVKTVYRLQDEVAALAGQVVELRERLNRNEADS